VTDSELKALAERCLVEYQKFTTEQCAYFGFCSHDSVILANAVLRLQKQLLLALATLDHIHGSVGGFGDISFIGNRMKAIQALEVES